MKVKVTTISMMHGFVKIVRLKKIMLAATIMLATVFAAQAATYTVTNADDGGAGSLRQAITDANANGAGLDTIVFAASLANQTLTLTHPNGELSITSDMTIDATGVANLSVSGGGTRRVFNIQSEGAIVVMTGFRITGGNGRGTPGAIIEDGGAIRNTGNLTLNSMIIQTNTARSGGGVSTSGFNHSLTINGSSILGNSATSSGGGMFAAGGSTTTTNSTLSDNTAQLAGGGIFFRNGPHIITGTTLSGNAAGSGSSPLFSGGGGLVNLLGTVNISNSTVSGNSSGCDCGGGGIITFSGGITNLRNVTIANNTASAGPGGGIETSGRTNIGNTIVADNTAPTNPDVNGAIISQGFNLVRNRGTSTGYVASDLPDGSNPVLEALGNNGGPTQTHELLFGSLAIDAGSNALAVTPRNNAALTTDQRGAGFARIVDGDGNGTATVDIGAFEVQLAPTATIIVNSATDTFTGGDGQCTLREAISNANNGALPAGDCAAGSGADTIVFAASLTNQTLTLTHPNGELSITSDMTIDATGVANLSVSGGGTRRVFNIQSAAIVVMTGFRITGGNGRATPGAIIEDGGAIRNTGNLTLNSMIIQTNTARSGGGVSTDGFNNRLTINGSSILGNSATSSGGGMFAITSETTITNSTLSGNTARLEGGGIYIQGGPHIITGTTLSGNAAGSGSSPLFGGGGGLVNVIATVNISNSTVSGNSSGCDCGGGGITTFNGGITNLRNVTIANNTASAGPGGGIETSGRTNIGNTIVADNTAPTNPDVNGAIISQGFNLVRNRGTSTGYVASDLPDGSNPVLEALGNNGGPTQTHELLFGSLAVDAGSNALAVVTPRSNAALTTDQRGAGFARIVDGDGNGTATVDIGAFEAQTTPATLAFSINDVTQNEGDSGTTDFTFTVTLSAAVTQPVTVSYMTANDTATAPSDYAAIPQTTLTFAPGETSKQVTVAVVGDAVFESTETFFVNLSNAQGAVISDNQGVGTITNDDAAPNTPPTAANDSKTTNEDTTLVFSSSDLTANDSAGPANESTQTLTVTMVISTVNTNGTVSLNNGQISYQPAANYNGAASFDYKVCDNGTTSGQPDPQCAIATVNVTVSAVNDVPVANGGSITTNEDTPSSAFMLTGSDADGDALTFEIVTAPVKGTYNQATGIYTPNANANGSDSFTFIAKDAVSQSPSATVSITINAVNDAPTMTGATVSRGQAAGGTVSTIATVADVDNTAGSLSVSVTSLPTGITVTGITNTNGTITATVTADCNAAVGANTVRLKVTDGENAIGTANLTVNVTKETTPPVINPISNIVVTLPANSNAASMVVNFPLPTASDNCSTPTVTTDPVSGSEFPFGTTTVNVTATDAAGNITTSSFTVTVLYRFSLFSYGGVLFNEQQLNQVTAGSDVPVRFTLSGYKGNPYSSPPTSEPISCSTFLPTGAATVINRYAPDPMYHSTFDFYQTTWKTQASWKFTCRRLTLYLTDGTTKSLNFYFK